METIGAPHSSDAARHCSSVSVWLMVDSYSRIRPQPVQVRLQACSGSSIITSGNRLLSIGCACRSTAGLLDPYSTLKGFAGSLPTFTDTCHSGGGLILFFAM